MKHEKKMGGARGDRRIDLKDRPPNRKTLSVILRELQGIESRKPFPIKTLTGWYMNYTD